MAEQEGIDVNSKRDTVTLIYDNTSCRESYQHMEQSGQGYSIAATLINSFKGHLQKMRSKDESAFGLQWTNQL